MAGWSRWRTSAGTTAAGNFPLYQIVWPNHDGLYPWSPRATKGVATCIGRKAWKLSNPGNLTEIHYQGNVMQCQSPNPS
jgi:hypothetical protein